MCVCVLGSGAFRAWSRSVRLGSLSLVRRASPRLRRLGRALAAAACALPPTALAEQSTRRPVASFRSCSARLAGSTWVRGASSPLSCQSLCGLFVLRSLGRVSLCALVLAFHVLPSRVTCSGRRGLTRVVRTAPRPHTHDKRGAQRAGIEWSAVMPLARARNHARYTTERTRASEPAPSTATRALLQNSVVHFRATGLVHAMHTAPVSLQQPNQR